MRALDLLPRLDEIAPDPATDLPASMVWLAVEEGRPLPSWDEAREWLVDDRGITGSAAEALILEAVNTGDLLASINETGDGWELAVDPAALRAVLLRYAMTRLDKLSIDLDNVAAYRAGDSWLVLPMLAELLALAEGETPPPRPALYVQLLTEP